MFLLLVWPFIDEFMIWRWQTLQNKNSIKLNIESVFYEQEWKKKTHTNCLNRKRICRDNARKTYNGRLFRTPFDFIHNNKCAILNIYTFSSALTKLNFMLYGMAWQLQIQHKNPSVWLLSTIFVCVYVVGYCLCTDCVRYDSLPWINYISQTCTRVSNEKKNGNGFFKTFFFRSFV